MTQQAYTWPVTISTPAGTAIATPQVTFPGIGDIWLEKAEIQVPSGPTGLTGVYIANNGTAIVPFATPAQWLVLNDDLVDYPVGVEVSSGLSIVTYNTDTFAHTTYIRLIGQYMSVQNAPLSAGLQMAPVSAS